MILNSVVFETSGNCMERPLIVKRLFSLFCIHTLSEIISSYTGSTTPLFIMNNLMAFPKLTTPVHHFSFIHVSRPICCTQLTLNFSNNMSSCIQKSNHCSDFITGRLFIFTLVTAYCKGKQQWTGDNIAVTCPTDQLKLLSMYELIVGAIHRLQPISPQF